MKKQTRNSKYAAIHANINKLGMSDDEYRHMLYDRYGVDTAKDLNERQLTELRNDLTARAASVQRQLNSKSKPKAVLYKEAQIDKIEALLAEKGRVEGQYIPWSYAHSILEKQCGIKRLEWAKPKQLKAVITALILDAKRHGRRIA